jgi:hypothetical protein
MPYFARAIDTQQNNTQNNDTLIKGLIPKLGIKGTKHNNIASSVVMLSVTFYLLLC